MIRKGNRMKSVMEHSFSRVPSAEIQRSSFDRSHGYKTTFDAGYLVPIFMDEALPGDTFNLNLTAFARLATPLKPVMDNMFMDVFFFAVPIRLIWNNWEKMNGAQDDPGDSTDYLVPVLDAPNPGGHEVGSLFDYFGIPTEIASLEHSALWSRAYNLIWNQWFRDQNLQDSVVVDKDDGPDDPTDYVLLRRGKRHDYFTSCLPWPQKGDDVSLPLGTSAPVVTTDETIKLTLDQVNWNYVQANSGLNDYIRLEPNVAGGSDDLMKFGDQTGLETDLSTATAATINALRQAFQLQRLYERDARGGTRYTEIVQSHFGVTSPDARLQRPEYLGGGSFPVNVHPVPQMSVAGATPQGNLAAIGTASISRSGFSKSFTEHCILLGLVSVRADLTYQQGLNRMFSRRTRWDFYWPALAHLGEQAVLNKEIYADGTANDEDVFGYQERYAEYRYKPSVITGQFRSTFATTLDVWHLSQEFGALPVLDDTFIQENPPVDRVIAVPAEPHFLYDSYINLKCARPMPVYGVPGLIDHF